MYACQVAWPSSGNATISPSMPGIRLRETGRTSAPQVSMTGRLFQTSAMLVPIAVKASKRSLSSMGIESALMAKAKAANNPPITVPTTSIDQPIGVEQHDRDVIEAGKRPQAEEQRVDDDGRAHPKQHQQAKDRADEQDLAAGSGFDEDHVAQLTGSPAAIRRLFS